ncbi:MAG: hypothetical protein RSE56_03320 [Bacilli bacterium]
MSLNILQNCYIIVCVIFGAAVIATILYILLRPRYFKSNFLKIYGKRIYKYVTDYDLLLINNFTIRRLSTKPLINHIIFGKKFIYLIRDYYFIGALEGSTSDNNLIYFKYKAKPKYINNPFLEQETAVNAFISITNIERELIKSIVIVNDDTILNISDLHESVTLVKEKELVKLIKDFESSNIKDIPQEKLELVANEIAKLNERKNDE